MGDKLRSPTIVRFLTCLSYREARVLQELNYKSLSIRFQESFNFLDLWTKSPLQSYLFSIKCFKVKSTVKSCLHNWPQFVNELKTPPV